MNTRDERRGENAAGTDNASVIVRPPGTYVGEGETELEADEAEAELAEDDPED
jgi:hypothetical protein